MNIFIDHRARLPEARDQGARPTCMAFAISDGHTFYRNNTKLLSAEYLFCKGKQRQLPLNHNDGLYVNTAIDALNVDGQPEEVFFPYQVQANSTLPVPAVPFGKPTYHKLLTSNKSGIDQIIQLLDAKQSPVILLKIIDSFFRYKKNDAPIDTNCTKAHRGNHAVLAVGHAVTTLGARCILIRNSWGVGWGDGGHGWVSETYITENLICVLSC